MPKFIKQNAGALVEEATVTAGGAPNAGKVPELDGNGRLHNSMMPTGIGADTAVIAASEALAAGDFINVWDSSGAKVRKADGSAAGKPANGFVLTAVASGANATVYFEGTNDQVSGQTPGEVFLSATAAGKTVAEAPTGAGKVVQSLGIAISPTAINFERGAPIILA